jgi:hypothetical protein
MGAPVLGRAMVLVKTRAKMVVVMIMAMPTGRAMRPHSLDLLLCLHQSLRWPMLRCWLLIASWPVPWRCWHRLLVASPVEALAAMAGAGVVLVVLSGPVLSGHLRDTPALVHTDYWASRRGALSSYSGAEVLAAQCDWWADGVLCRTIASGIYQCLVGHFQCHAAYGPPCDLVGVYQCFPLVLYSCWFAEQQAIRVSRAKARKHDCDGVCEQVQPSCTVCWDSCGYWWEEDGPFQSWSLLHLAREAVYRGLLDLWCFDECCHCYGETSAWLLSWVEA